MGDTAIPDDTATIESLADLPIEVAEAMYSPDFVELVTLSAGGTPLVLPMSFTLDVAGNAARFSSPVAAARIANLVRDGRCCVSFSRVTSGYPAVVMQGVATLGEVAEGVRRGPARRFIVAPRRVVSLEQPPRAWSFPAGGTAAEAGSDGAGPAAARRRAAAPVTDADLDAITRFETAVIALRDENGWPISISVEVRREGEALLVSLPDAGTTIVDGPASLLGHTWTKDGPRYLALTGSSWFLVPSSAGIGDNPYSEPGTRNQELTFLPSRAMRRA